MSVKIGNTDIKDFKIGNTQILKMYKGINSIFEKNSLPSTDTLLTSAQISALATSKGQDGKAYDGYGNEILNWSSTWKLNGTSATSYYGYYASFTGNQKAQWTTMEVPYPAIINGTVINCINSLFNYSGTMTEIFEIPNSIIKLYNIYDNAKKVSGTMRVPAGCTAFGNKMFTNTVNAITLEYHSSDTVVANYSAPANVTKVAID